MARLSNRRLKEIRSLASKKYRERYGETIVEGTRAVESALDGGADVRDVLVTEAVRREDRLGVRLAPLNDRVHVVQEDVLASISDVETSQGVVAVVGFGRVDAEMVSSMTRLVAFDGIRDPGNAGTMIRTAAWFGVEAVLTPPGTVDLYNPKVVRASMGGLWDVDHAEVTDLAATLRHLRGRGFAVYGADMHGTEIDAWEPSGPSVLVVGSEAHGLSAEVSETIGERILIPKRARRGATESLNVGVAAGILMYAWTRASAGGADRR